MRHPTPPRQAARSGSVGTAAGGPLPVGLRTLALVVLAATVLALAGCSTGTPASTDAPAAASATATPVSAVTPAPPMTATPAAATVAPATPATPPATPSMSAGPGTLSSPFYAYSITFPAGWSPGPAQTAWDGTARIDSNGPLVDRATGPGSKLFFVYGAPTDRDLAAWSAKGQTDVNRWHGCPATAESETDITIGGTPGRLHAFHCNSLYVMKAFAVRDGFGWAFNQLSPPGNEAADTAGFTEMLGGVDLSK